MTYGNCLLEKSSDFFVGIILLGFGILLSVIGLTILPLVGIFLSIPLFAMSWPFIGATFNHSCALEGNQQLRSKR